MKSVDKATLKRLHDEYKTAEDVANKLAEELEAAQTKKKDAYRVFEAAKIVYDDERLRIRIDKHMLTENQAAVLLPMSRGAGLECQTLWTGDRRYYLEGLTRVNGVVVTSLERLRYIATRKSYSWNETSVYYITDAGRRALERYQTKEVR